MDRTIWNNVVQAVDRAVRAVGCYGRLPKYSDRLITLMLLWAVWHDRSLSWACDRMHYNRLFRPRALPSISRFIRRVKSDRVREILQHVHNDLAACGCACPFDLLSYIDGKALTVSPVSKDPDAKRGKISGGYAKGYKLHAYINEQKRVMIWSVTPLNGDEKTTAAQLIECVPRGAGDCDSASGVALHAPLTLGDKSYDSANLHRAFETQGRYLLTPLRGEKFVGKKGRSAKTLAEMGPRRREVLKVWENNGKLARYVLKSRIGAEGTFSVLSLACGLDRLPGFVRRMGRVTRWVGCKVILYHARLLAQELKEKQVA